MIRLVLLMMLFGGPATADTVFAARTIPAQTILGPADLALRDIEMPGAVSDPSELIGKETRTAIYAGRPFRAGDVGQPAIVDRNQMISLIYKTGGLMIATEGRSLSRAAVGETIRVMNLSSRTTVMARLGADGHAYVGGMGR